MSGEKRTPIQVLQDQMQENRQQIYNIQQQRDRLQQELRKVRTENATELSLLRSKMDEREQQQASVVDTLKSDLREMASQHHQQITTHRKLVLQEMQELEARTGHQVANLRSWAQERLNEQRSEYTRISQQQQQQINLLKRDIESINRREEHREQRARDYLSDLETLIQCANQHLPHERYTPGGLERIKRRLEAARRQLNEDVPAAAIATVQAAHFELMDLEEEIARRETEFELTYRTVADAVSALFAAVRQNRHIQLESDATLQEADYWTQGRYQQLEERIGKMKEHITQYKQQLTAEELNNYLNDLETLTREQELLVAEAVERIISSQLRAEMADMVIEKLEEQGYRVKDDEYGYAAKDQRNAYLVKLCNVAETEIVAVISPDEKTYQNTLSINTYNEETADDESRRQRNREILESLRLGGLQLGETQCNEQSIRELYDVGDLVKKGKDKLPQQVLQKAGKLSSTASQSASDPSI